MAPFDSCVIDIAAFFDCRVWSEYGPEAALRYIFFGLRGDVAAATVFTTGDVARDTADLSTQLLAKYTIDITGGSRRITRDDSLAEEMVAAGLASMDDAMASPQAHVITRRLGAGSSIASRPTRKRSSPSRARSRARSSTRSRSSSLRW